MIVLVFVLGNGAGDGDADHSPRSSASSPGSALVGVARHGDRRALDRPDPRDHARPRGRRRLLPVHRQPLPGALDGGMEYQEAVARAVATSGGAVLFAGSTVVISLLCLYFGGIPQVQELGYSAAIAGRRGDRRLADDAPGRAQPARPHGSTRCGCASTFPRRARSTQITRNGWARWAAGIGRHPVIAAAGAGSWSCWCSRSRSPRSTSAPRTTARCRQSTTIRQSYDALTEGFGVGYNGPLLVAVDMKPPAHNDQKSLNQLNQQQQNSSRPAAGTAADHSSPAVHAAAGGRGRPGPAEQQAQQQATAAGRVPGPEPDQSSSSSTTSRSSS